MFTHTLTPIQKHTPTFHFELKTEKPCTPQHYPSYTYTHSIQKTHSKIQLEVKKTQKPVLHPHSHSPNSKYSLVRAKFSTVTGETKVITTYTQVMLLRINKIAKIYLYSHNTEQVIVHTDTFIHTHPHSHTITKLYSSSQPKTYTSQHNPSHTHTHLAQEHDPSSTLSLKPQKPAFHNIIHHTLRLTYFKNSIQLTL